MATLVRICYSANAAVKDQNIFTLLSVLKFSLIVLDGNMDLNRDFLNSKEYFTCCVNFAALLMCLTLSEKLIST